MNFGIAILPNREIQQQANSYRKRYDPHYKLIPPHITLKESFNITSDSELSSLITYLVEVAQNTSPFSLTVSKISTFYPANNVIYFAIDENEHLNQLHQQFHRGEPETDRPYAFIPHITIAQKMDMDEMLDIYSGIKMSDVKSEFVVDQFHLFKQGKDKKWSIYQSYPLLQK